MSLSGTYADLRDGADEYIYADYVRVFRALITDYNDVRKKLWGPAWVNIKGDYGAFGDNSTNDSAAIQAAIDDVAAAGGGVVLCPPATYRCNVVLKDGVLLLGTAGRFGYLAQIPGVSQTTFRPFSTGVCVDTPATQTIGCGVQGINFQGFGPATAAKGVRFQDVAWGFIRGCHFFNFADEGVQVVSPSIACSFEDLLLVGCVTNRSRAATIGAFDVGGTDHYVSRVQSGIGGSQEGTVQSTNLYVVGVAWRASTSVLDSLNGEFSDIGIEVLGNMNAFTACRADFNYGHGWRVSGSQNRFTGCFGINNSQDTTNTYSHYQATSTSAFNIFTGCLATDALAKKPKYGFEDLVQSAANKNVYAGCVSVTALTAQFISAASNGSAFFFPSGAFKTLTANSATPDVSGYGYFLTANSSTTTITNFAGGVAGQRIVVLCNDANTTIQHNGSTITLATPGNKTLRSGVHYEFIASGTGVWREIVPLPLGVTADVGDAAKTLQARVNEETQVWNTPLTATRAVTLSTTGAYAGASFRIVRTAAATGAFNLNVGAGPLKALAAGQWCDVTYTGSAWVLTAAGSL